MPGIKGMKHKRPRTKKERNTYAAIRIEEILDQAREGEIELTPARLKAIEIAYSRLKPTLAAVEQTIVDPRDQVDPNEIAGRLAALFAEKPQLWDQVVALRASQQAHENSTEHQVTH